MYRLVIVDDEKIVIRGIQVLLAKMDLACEVVGTASDGREALEVLRRTQPDVLITDIRIPYLDGLSLIESAQEFLTGCDCIIISAYQEFSYARRALYLGALDYIDKPVTRDKLRDAFARLFARREERTGRAKEDGKEKEPAGTETISAANDPALQSCSGMENAAGTEPGTEKDVGNERIAGILSYLQKNYQQDIGLTELSALTGMNPAYLSVLFKETVGTSFVKYLTNLRLARAKELLQNTDLRSADIAEAVGYHDPHYFYEIFKKKTGQTPGSYRDSHPGKEKT